MRLLHYTPSACKALSQGFQAASSSPCAACLSPSSAFYLRVPSLNISLPREAATNRGAVLQALISSRRSVSVGYPLAFSAPRSYLMKYDRQLIPLPRSIMKTSPSSGKNRERLSSNCAGKGCGDKPAAGTVRVSLLSVVWLLIELATFWNAARPRLRAGGVPGNRALGCRDSLPVPGH